MAPETPKVASSRLLTMKFMQRAAASAASSPDSDGQSSKKRKYEHSSPQGRLSDAIDKAAIRAALEDQESKRSAALQQHKAADTHWVLKPSMTKPSSATPPTAPMNIVYVGYGEIDSADDSADGEDVPSQGRTSTRKAKPPKVDKKESDDDESDKDSDDEDSDDSPKRKRAASDANRSRSQSRSRSKQPTAELSKAKEFRDKRKKKDVSLNNMTSISSGGGNSFSRKGGRR